MDENEVYEVEAKSRPHWSSVLNENQLKGAELMALGKYTQKKIAEILGVEEQTISRRWKHNPVFMQYVDYLTTQNTLDSALRVKGLTLEAIDVYSALLKNPNPNVRFRVAKDVLDRAGVKDLKFDLLPKDGDTKDKKDYETLKKRLLAIVESEEAGDGIDEEEIIKMNKWGVEEDKIIDIFPEAVIPEDGDTSVEEQSEEEQAEDEFDEDEFDAEGEYED
jgi:transcriptional regulator with XRE-family HTH domain